MTFKDGEKSIKLMFIHCIKGIKFIEGGVYVKYYRTINGGKSRSKNNF